MSITETEQIKPFATFDEYDEDQIVKEMQGQILEQYFYSFSEGTRKVVGISYAGIRHVVAELMRQGFPLSTDCNVEDAGDCFRAKAIATNITTKASYTGFAEQKKKFRNGQENPFAYTQAASKAERNALRKHIDEKIITEAYKEWSKRKSHNEAKSEDADSGPQNAKTVGKKSVADYKGQAILELDEVVRGLKVNWFTKDVKGNRLWKEGDESGFCNFPKEDKNGYLRAIISAINENRGGVIIGDELFSKDETKGQLFRSRIKGSEAEKTIDSLIQELPGPLGV
ncbi:MAG: hypothetical protein ACYCQJ_12790 [Nitrososphaerales archaeon]